MPRTATSKPPKNCKPKRTTTTPNALDTYLTILEDALEVYHAIHDDERAIPKHWETVCNDADDAFREAVQLARRRREEEPLKLLQEIHEDIYALMIAAHLKRQTDLYVKICKTMVDLRMFVDPADAERSTPGPIESKAAAELLDEPVLVNAGVATASAVAVGILSTTDRDRIKFSGPVAEPDDLMTTRAVTTKYFVKDRTLRRHIKEGLKSYRKNPNGTHIFSEADIKAKGWPLR